MMGIIKKTMIRIPINQPGFNGMSTGFFSVKLGLGGWSIDLFRRPNSIFEVEIWWEIEAILLERFLGVVFQFLRRGLPFKSEGSNYLFNFWLGNQKKFQPAIPTQQPHPHL